MKTVMKIGLMIILAVLLVLFLIQNAGAETYNGVNIYRAAPDSAFIGQKIWVTLVFENTASESRTIAVNESLAGGAEFNQSEAKYIQAEYGEKIWYYEWKITLGPEANTSVAYWLVPKAVGTYVISPARVTINGQSYMLKSHAIEVRCNANEACEAGENYLNCPEDCNTGSADGICDAVADGRCDPDCEQTADPDCEPAETPKQLGKETPPAAPGEKQAQGWTGPALIMFIIIGAVVITVAGLIFWRRMKGGKRKK